MYINSESQMSHIHNIPALQINTFQVRLNTGQIINEPIENIRELSNIIGLYGLGIIAKISFYFRDNSHQFHNLILRNTEHNDKFVVEFYHYYNQYMERIKLSREERLNDFIAVMNCIRSSENLDSQLGKQIIDPFYHPQVIS
jgi:hypothetical protein|uniref:Uncharacterized protein n=1 Tax=viral metagenome TaxID=1070528 RepID=A0A6C0DWP1_9ZZZZ